MHEIVVPKLNNNDDDYVLVEWFFDEGTVVSPGAEVVVVETSKAAEELVSEDGGLLHRTASVNDRCRPGEVIGRLFADEEERERFLADNPGGTTGPATPAATTLVTTDAARELIERHGITEEQLLGLGKKTIKSADVEALAAGEAGACELLPVSRSQRAVADVVTAAHREIPVAFTVMRVDVGPALELAREVAELNGGVVGLPEILVKCVARQIDTFPVFFATVRNDGLVPAQEVSVGVTMDVGTGLYIPVLRDPAALPLGDIADIMMDFRIKAMRGSFRAQDLTDASIVISLNNDQDVVFAQPIIFPTQTCMLSLGAVLAEYAPREDGTVGVRHIAHVGIAYDHRFINGRDAVMFLQALKAQLNSPQLLAEAGVAS